MYMYMYMFVYRFLNCGMTVVYMTCTCILCGGGDLAWYSTCTCTVYYVVVTLHGTVHVHVLYSMWWWVTLHGIVHVHVMYIQGLHNSLSRVVTIKKMCILPVSEVCC